MLRFQVQGSAKAPYRVSFEGEGRLLAAFCTCPAFARGGLFCKHSAALLMGDVTALVGEHADISELSRRAAGSPLLERALHHQPAKPKPTSGPARFVGLAQVEAEYAPAMLAKGWTLQRAGDDEGGEALLIYTPTKTGRMRKHPTIRLEYEPWAAEPSDMTASITLNLNGDVTVVSSGGERVPSPRPWRLSAPGLTRAWGILDRAIPDFEKVLAAASDAK